MNEMDKMIARAEVMHCMKYYLRDIRAKCPDDYYRKRRAEVLEAARAVIAAPCYEALAELIEEMEAKENV